MRSSNLSRLPILRQGFARCRVRVRMVPHARREACYVARINEGSRVRLDREPSREPLEEPAIEVDPLLKGGGTCRCAETHLDSVALRNSRKNRVAESSSCARCDAPGPAGVPRLQWRASNFLTTGHIFA